MKTIAYICMLIWCMFGIPQEKWNAMTDSQQDEALSDLADEAMKELGCDEVEMNAYAEGKWTVIYGECTAGQYIAYLKGDGT